ncbi:hypothetical protein AVEN_270575-1 [Araneus ventricosus]|uniref:Uncharacterized protein n=1 Tax=Araneus ventricosus TaxID=182803 RepID=A0A4Y2B5Q0_ARAVE|nr:hypothetical protein AVEN_270575-1 [Araneus ventricosus]
MKISKTKSLVRPNKCRFPVNAIEKSHFLHSEVISGEKGNEALDAISQVKCHESRNKSFSMKIVSDINQEIIEDAEFGSEPEKEKQTRFRNNTLTVDYELIPDYKIPANANRLKNSAQKKPNTDSSETKTLNENPLISVMGDNDDSDRREI